jgi:hypothetical protein
MEDGMSMHYAIRLVAGTFVLISLALGYWVNPLWFLFTAFVGVNLIQSAFTRWCLMEKILTGLGVVKPEGAPHQRVA